MLIYWIWLSTRTGLGDRGRMALLERYADAEDIYFAVEQVFSVLDGISQEAVAALQDKNLAQAERLMEECNRKHIHILTYRDAAYPNRLRNIADPPVVLYYKGRLPDFDGSPVIAIVGTRSASPYGLTVAKRMGSQIASCGGLVLSGMAYGIDGMAMRGALSAGAPVVGVLGCGVDVVYPLSNRALFADTEQCGCILSEFVPGTPPSKWNFPKRNRLLSGLSCGVLVVEAPERSGALITADRAAEQGRDVFVVPGNIDMPSCAGSNALLRDGAIAVSSGWDVLDEYAALFPDKIQRNTTPSRQTVYPDEVEKMAQPEPLKVAEPVEKVGRNSKKNKKEIDKSKTSQYSDAETKTFVLSAEETRITEMIRGGTELVDDIIAQTGMPAGAVLAVLTMLEIKGVVTRLPGKRVKMK